MVCIAMDNTHVGSVQTLTRAILVALYVVIFTTGAIAAKMSRISESTHMIT